MTTQTVSPPVPIVPGTYGAAVPCSHLSECRRRAFLDCAGTATIIVEWGPSASGPWVPDGASISSAVPGDLLADIACTHVRAKRVTGIDAATLTICSPPPCGVSPDQSREVSYSELSTDESINSLAFAPLLTIAPFDVTLDTAYRFTVSVSAGGGTQDRLFLRLVVDGATVAEWPLGGVLGLAGFSVAVTWTVKWIAPASASGVTASLAWACADILDTYTCDAATDVLHGAHVFVDEIVT